MLKNSRNVTKYLHTLNKGCIFVPTKTKTNNLKINNYG
nr:MAG TPA: hypothetical protein [Caudoviricetes sp.]